jgi:tetratricopeptide (TPR) repeat protein
MTTPPHNPELDETFTERVDKLFRELELAIRYDRPSILLALYQSEFVRQDAEAALTERLRPLGHTTTTYRIHEENADLLPILAAHPDRQKAVFFISGLQWGGGADGLNAYRALNIRREYFVDYCIRAVLWLTEAEAIKLPRHAPDFWAFRHRTVEFMDAPEPGKVVPMAKEMAWRDWEDRTLGEDTDAKIALRESLLADLPEGEESLAARADLLYTLAGLYWAKQDYETAIVLLGEALRAFEQLEDTHHQSWCQNGLGNVYSDLGRLDEATHEYTRAIELNPKSALPHNGLGNVYRGLGRLDEAAHEYTRAIELDPKYANPHDGLGNVYADLGRLDEATHEYTRAIELDPKYANPHNGLGNMYRGLGRLDDATHEYTRAIELDPKDALPHNGLGNVYADQGRLDDATNEYTRAIELDPKDAYPHNGLGTVYADQGRLDDAAQEYTCAIELDPKFANPHIGLGDVYRDQGRLDDAANEYTCAIELDQKLPHPHYNLARLEATRGDADLALQHLERAVALDARWKEYARKNEDFAALRDDPRFQALVKDA